MSELIIKKYEDRCYYQKHTLKEGKDKPIEDTTIISNFVICPIKCIRCRDTLEYYVIFKYINNGKVHEKELVFDISAFQDSKTFRKIASKQYAIFEYVGTDIDLEKIKTMMATECTKELIGVEYTGLIKNDNKWIYIDKNTEDQNLFLEKDNIINDTFDLNNVPTKDDLLKIAAPLFNFNISEIVYTMLAICAKSFLCARFKDLKFKTPIGNLTGESGSGKSTTIENILQPICHHSESGEVAASAKEFVIFKMLSSSNIIPMIIEEYKEHTMKDQTISLISNILRSSYDGHMSGRGRMNQTINKYTIRGSLNIVGETSFEDTADKERSMVLIFSKLFHNDTFLKNMDILSENQDILLSLGNLILKKTLEMLDDRIIEIYENAINHIKIKLPSRIKHNCAISTVCYSIFYEIFKDIVDIKDLNSATDIIVKSQLDFNLEGREKTKSVIDNTFELFSVMIEQGLLIEYTDFVIKNDDFCIKLRDSYHKLTKYIRDFNIKTEYYQNYDTFRKQVERSEYIIKKNVPIRPGNSRQWTIYKRDTCKKTEVQKCHVFNLNALSKLEFCYKLDEKDNEEYEPEVSLPVPPNEEYKLFNIGKAILINGDIYLKSEKVNINEDNFNKLMGLIFIDDDEKVFIPKDFSIGAQEILRRNLFLRGEKVFNVGDNYIEIMKNKQNKYIQTKIGG
jgi:energy-coupling factor transporter ATP-binding protein EcfA2